MTKPTKTFFYSIAAAAILGLMLGLIIMAAQKTTPARGTIKPCAVGAAPCIELLDARGARVAAFNDFRFNGRDCLDYLPVAQNEWVRYCGAGYRLHWIGATH
jgi:hypothetical protein